MENKLIIDVLANREALILRFLLGLDIQEIGAALGLSVGGANGHGRDGTGGGGGR